MTDGGDAFEPDRGLVARLAANTLAHALGTAAGAAVGFFTFVAVARGLGPTAFGDLTAATVLLWIPVVLADVGLSTAVVRGISAAPERTEHVIRVLAPVRAAIGAALVALTVAVGLAAPLTARTHEAIAIGALGAFLALLTLSLSPVLEARLQVAWAVAASLAGRLATLGLTLGALALDLGFASIVWAQVAGHAVTFVAQVLVVRRLISLRPRWDLREARTLLRGSLALGAALSIAMVYFRIDAVLLALLSTSRDVGLYSAAYRFLELSVLVVGALGVSLLPPLSQFVARGDPSVPALIQRAFDVFVAAAVPLAVVLFAFAEPLVELTSGAEFEEGATALRILAPYVLLSFVGALFWRVLIATREDRVLLAIAVAVLVGNVVANLLLLPPYGFEAAAAVTLASEAALVTLAAWAARRRLGSLPSLAPLAPVAVATAAMVAAIAVVPGPAPLVAALSVVVYAGALVVLPGTVRDVVGRLRAA